MVLLASPYAFGYGYGYGYGLGLGLGLPYYGLASYPVATLGGYLL